MKIKKKSGYKNETEDKKQFFNWFNEVQKHNGRQYEKISLKTSLGETWIWKHDTAPSPQETLVIFPGFRTSPLFFDLDKELDYLNTPLRVYMIETNGQPNPSDGNSPDIKSLDYGHWANEVLDKLGIQKTFVVGASFGGLICMKLAMVHPEKIKAAFLCNAGSLQSFSLSFKNLYYNILPIISPKRKNVIKFLDKAVFHKPNHQLSSKAEELLINFEVLALTRYKDKTQKPYYMGEEMKKVNVPVYILEGDKDILFPYEKSIKNARKFLPNIQDIRIFPNVGHGIETYPETMKYIGEKIRTIIHTKTASA